MDFPCLKECLSIPIPTGRTRWIIESEAQALMATPIRGYARYLATTTGKHGCRQETSQLGRYDSREQRVLGQYGEGFSHITENPMPYTYLMEGNSEDGTTTSGSTQTTTASRTWNSDTLPRGTVLRRDRVTGRTRMVVTGEFIPEEEILEFPR